MNKLRWGVIGLGVGYRHALAIIADESFTLTAVCDIDNLKTAHARKTLGDVLTFNDAFNMLASVELDAIVVASYDWDHAETIIKAVDSGVHVFAEKPIATNWTELEQVAACLERNPCIRMTTNTLLRWSPRFRWLKRQVDEGEIGSIYHMQGDYLYGRLPKLTHGWRGENSEYSVTLGGVIHMIDLMTWLADELPTSVAAIGSNAGISFNLRDEPTSFSGDCLRTGLMEFDSGLTAGISSNFASSGPHFHQLELYGTAGTFTNVPACSLKSDSLPTSAATLFRGPDPGTGRSVQVPYPAVPKATLVTEFGRSLMSKDEPPISEQEALNSLSICLAIDDSVRTREFVTITYRKLVGRGSVSDNN